MLVSIITLNKLCKGRRPSIMRLSFVMESKKLLNLSFVFIIFYLLSKCKLLRLRLIFSRRWLSLKLNSATVMNTLTAGANRLLIRDKENKFRIFFRRGL